MGAGDWLSNRDGRVPDGVNRGDDGLDDVLVVKQWTTGARRAHDIIVNLVRFVALLE